MLYTSGMEPLEVDEEERARLRELSRAPTAGGWVRGVLREERDIFRVWPRMRSRSKTSSPALLVLCWGLLAACSGTSTEQDPDAGVDAGMDAGRTTLLSPAPSGVGFCCPGEPARCSCFKNGGWVPVDAPSRCPTTCDLAPPTIVQTDPHGCEYQTGTHYCFPPYPPEDGGP